MRRICNQWCRVARNQRGVALPLALFGLIAVTVLVTATVVTSSTEGAISAAHRSATGSLYTADGALDGFLSNVNTLQAGSNWAVLWPTDQPQVFTAPSGEQVAVTVRLVRRGPIVVNPTDVNHRKRVDTYSILVEPRGNAPGRSVGALVRVEREWNRFRVNITSAASIASERVSIGGSTLISGIQDSKQCASTETLKDVTLASNTHIDKLQEKALAQGIAGLERSSLDGQALTRHILGDMTPQQIAEMADIRFGEPLIQNRPWGTAEYGTSPSSDLYAKGHPMNWGCPHLMGVGCRRDGDETYFPSVGIAMPNGGEVHINGGHGQGMLIILGDLRINGTFKYNGIVIVAGDVNKMNGGAQIQGALIATGDVTLDPTLQDGSTDGADLTGNSMIQFNRCAVAAAQQAFDDSRADNIRQKFDSPTHAWFEVVR